ncbi:MAG TPA: glycosyltransferase, partial [Dehalococcoidia bacterium]|nr:glycosyltransferase [Dehalococcoidia bacterium]
MRLLIIGINYAPEEAGNAPYTTGFAEHMASIGHEVHILTGVPHYPGWKKRPTSDLDAADHVRNGVNVHRRQHYVPGRQSAVRRALYEASFLASAPSLLSLPRPDAVVGVVPILSDGLLASIASRRFGVPFGLIFQDLMGQAATQSAMSGGASVGGVVRAGEGWIARRASAVAIVADSFRPYVESLGVPPQAIVRVSNWNHIPTAETPRDEIRRELAWPSDEFVCLHAGNMGYKQGLANVIECARLAKDASPELLFVLAGDGNQRPELERAASEYELPNLRFLPTQTDQAYADLLGAADALILHQSGSVTDMSFPSKVGAYVAS